MTSHVTGIKLAHSIASRVLHYEQGYVGYSGSAGDASAVLLATGKTIIVECSRMVGANSSLSFGVEQTVLEAHLDSPIPVYIATGWPTAAKQRIHVDLGPARPVAELGGMSPEIETVPVGPWRRFWQAQSMLAPATAPPAHLASAVELTPDDLADPLLAARLSADEPCCDTEEPMPSRHLVDVEDSERKHLPWAWQVPHPERPLFHYAWTRDGYQLTDSEAMRERLRDHLRRVEELRSQPGGMTLVVTRPWRTLRPLPQRLLVMLLARVESTASGWASPIMESERTTESRGDPEG